MKRFLKWVLGIMAVLALGTAIAWFGFLKPDPPPISEEDRAYVTVMPLPAKLELGSNRLIINSGFDIQFPKMETPRLQKAMARFLTRLEDRIKKQLSDKSNKPLLINCQNKSNEHPNEQEDESYILTIKRNKIDISAPTEWGILHGLETLLQLAVQEDGEWYFPEVEVMDQPRFPWRGLMIDVSRHWIPKEVILRNLDAMAAVKMNVLHLHLTDHQGFRMESKTYPKLHEMGSDGNYFSQEDIKEIISYASERGIRVVPEFDLPGHSASWFVGYPELGSGTGPFELQTGWIGDAIMNPAKEYTYNFLDDFFKEMATLFPDRYMHIGGDEAVATHWDENPEIQAFIKQNGIEDNHALHSYFNQRLHEILKKHGKTMLGWDEIQDGNLPKEEIAIQAWRNHKSLWKAAKEGGKGILSTGYYLDHKQSADFHYAVDPEVIKGAVTIDIDSIHWKSFHNDMALNDMKMESDLYLFGEGPNHTGIMNFMGDSFSFTDGVIKNGVLTFSHEAQFGTLKYELEKKADSLSGEGKISVFSIQIKGKQTGGSEIPDGDPLPKFEKIEPLTSKQTANILGGEACMWTELANATTLESRIWPRAATIAEKLWSPKVLTDNTDDMYRRLIVMDDYLETRGTYHKKGMQMIIENMVSDKYYDPLKTLVNVLQEDKLFNRISIYDSVPNVNTLLNRIVDAARPESYVAYQFGKDVDVWLETFDEDIKSKLTEQFKDWQVNHQKLIPAFDEVELIREVEPHSRHLSLLAGLGLTALENPSDPKSEIQQDSLFAAAGRAYGGTLMNMVHPFQKLIQNKTTPQNK